MGLARLDDPNPWVLSRSSSNDVRLQRVPTPSQTHYDKKKKDDSKNLTSGTVKAHSNDLSSSNCGSGGNPSSASSLSNAVSSPKGANESRSIKTVEIEGEVNNLDFHERKEADIDWVDIMVSSLQATQKAINYISEQTSMEARFDVDSLFD